MKEKLKINTYLVTHTHTLVHKMHTEMGLGLTDLWCDVVWSATECRREPTISDVLLTHTKVSHLDVTLSIQ